MIFKHAGLLFDTKEMTMYETGEPGTPMIFQSSCGQHVIFTRMVYPGGVELHYATPQEIAYFAEKFHLPQLLVKKALGEVGAT